MKDGGYDLQGECLPMASFVAYRTDIESKQALANELTALRLGLLPQELHYWGKVKQIVKQLFTWRLERRTLSKEELVKLAGLHALSPFAV